ncbi:MAG: hypothetical protein K2Q18_14185 [Bdellovibrionales bacterium]|nr:hypothetical protein [Bdellovibrionales bacterium]
MDQQSSPLNFWTDVWSEGVIRFHQKNYNSHMVSFFNDFDLKGKTVFIPLAGKTNDIIYFLEKGAKVVAIEFVESAIDDFFTEKNIPYTKTNNEYHSENLTFLAMDFFNYHPEKPFDVLYDRASQVVFSESLRPKYYDHIKNFVHFETLLLLLSINHQGPRDYGPPFPISEHEIISQYEKMKIPLKLLSKTPETPSEKMQAQGITEIYNIVITSSNE